jgi:competence CoiA-like predicted nuclease
VENCLYRGKIICTYDLKDENGIYYEDKVLEWKQAAAKRELACGECGASVYLAAGLIKEPYFAHYDLEACEYGNGQESEELKKGKRLLYQLLKRSFNEGEVRVRERMDNGMYNTFCCHTLEGEVLAVDYRLQNNSLQQFQLRDACYQDKHIKPVYVMGMRQVKSVKQLDWYQTLLQNSMGYLVFLDTERESITLKKSFGYRLGKERKFEYCTGSYPVRELTLLPDGQFNCDFSQRCVRLQEQIQETKRNHEKRMLQLRQIQEENRRYQEFNPVILDKCRKLIEEGNAHLVSRKYYDAIMSEEQ